MKFGPSNVDRPVPERPVRLDEHGRAVGKVNVLEQPDHLGNVIAKEQIVVREVTDDLSLSLLQRLVPVPLAVALSLREVEEAHARIGEERLEGGSSVVLDTVSHD